MRLYVGLVHFPVINRNRQRIASAITTLDLHDIARLARTYDIKRFFVITPLEDQRRLAERVRWHWTEGHGARYNRDRKAAIELVKTVPSLGKALNSVEEAEGETPLCIATDASRQEDRSISYGEARGIIEQGRVVVLIFGTAWGLDRSVIDRADRVLDTIAGRTAYNPLSVRSAVAIILDRLTGTYE